MRDFRHAIVRAALAALLVSCGASCADATPAEPLSAAERDAARREPPGAGSAAITLAGADYVGAFMLDVTGDAVSFQLTGYDSVGRHFLSGKVILPSDFRRSNDGSIDFRFGGASDGSTGGISVHSGAHYWPVSGEVRADTTGLLAVRIVCVGIPEVGGDGLDIPGTGGERETLTVTGHLTATCNVRLPDGTVIMDPEHTANPRCAELLRGL